MRVFVVTAAYAAASAALAGAAASAEFCVSCAGPEAHYTCAFDEASADPNDSRLKLFCITELAKAGQHASCSVDRAQKMPCAGAVKRMAMPGGMEIGPLPVPAANSAADHAGTAAKPPAPTAPVAATAPPAQQQPVNQTDVAKEDAPPKTVEEMVKKGSASTNEALAKTGETAVEAAKSTGSAIGNAGKAVGNAAKKTWTCITSFFGDC